VDAIRTRFHGATNTRGARISADDGRGHRLTIGYPYELNSEQAHRRAALDWAYKFSTVGGVITATPAWFASDCYWTLSGSES
jgi:hypothetical protein